MDIKATPGSKLGRLDGPPDLAHGGEQGRLEQFGGYGKFLNDGRAAAALQIADSASVPAGFAAVGADGFKLANTIASAENIATSIKEFGFLGKTIGKIGGLADAASGISELLQTFTEEQGRTDKASKLNVATLGKSIEVTARIGATSIVGAAVCASAAVATGMAVLPIVAGAAAGVAAGYAAGQIAAGLRFGYKKIFGE